MLVGNLGEDARRKPGKKHQQEGRNGQGCWYEGHLGVVANLRSWVECTPRLSGGTSQRKDTVSVGISEKGNRITLKKFMFTLPETPATGADLSA